MSTFKANVQQDLEDFLKGRGRFDRSEYYGMSASEVPGLLAHYCDELAPDEQSDLTRRLTRVAIGDQEHLSAYLAASALWVFCAKGYLNQSSESVTLLEEEFTNPANVELWTHADEMTHSTGGADFKRTWSYAAILSSILKRLGSERAASTRQYLLEHADSEEFKDTLKKQ